MAKRILDTYDRDRNGVIDSIEVVPMIVDAYKSFNRVFSPSRADIESYLKILDRNGDGRVTIQDLEDLCSKYLTQKIWYLNFEYPIIFHIFYHSPSYHVLSIMKCNLHATPEYRCLINNMDYSLMPKSNRKGYFQQHLKAEGIQ